MNATILNSELRACLIEAGFMENMIRVGSAEYVLPTDQAIVNFGKRYHTFLWNNRLDSWISSVWDCTKFALSAMTMASIDNAVWQKANGVDQALAFGLCWVAQDAELSLHAINLAVMHDSTGKLTIKYYEPQVQASGDKLGEPYVCLQEKSRDFFSRPVFCYF